MQFVDGSSHVHAIGGAVSSVPYSYLVVPLLFSASSLAGKPALRPSTDSSHLPALSPLSPAGVREGLDSCLVCEDCLALLLASVISILL